MSGMPFVRVKNVVQTKVVPDQMQNSSPIQMQATELH